MILSHGLVVALAVVLLLALIAMRTPIFIALSVSGIAGLLCLSGPDGLKLVPLAMGAQLQEYALVAAPLYILLAEAPSPPGTRVNQRCAAPKRSRPSPVTASASPSRM